MFTSFQDSIICPGNAVGLCAPNVSWLGSNFDGELRHIYIAYCGAMVSSWVRLMAAPDLSVARGDCPNISPSFNRDNGRVSQNPFCCFHKRAVSWSRRKSFKPCSPSKSRKWIPQVQVQVLVSFVFVGMKDGIGFENEVTRILPPLPGTWSCVWAV